MSVCSPNYEADGNFPYRWCIVPECESSSLNTPNKLWIEAPTDLDTRTTWLNLAFRDSKKLPISKSQMYFCEDHFDLENDMEIYEHSKTMGSVERVRMKPNCVPTRFNCQKDRIKTTASHQQPEFLGYSENIPKNDNQRHGHRPSNYSMVIPNANRKKKLVKHYNATIPHTIRIKPNICYDIEKNEDKTKRSSMPKSLDKKDKQTKFIKEAFKIINSNQNSESINILANSLQNLSSTLLSAMINPNFNLGSQFDTKLPADINNSGNKALSSNITTASTENITYVNEEKAFIADSTNVDVTPAISTEQNFTNLKVNSFQDDSINVATKNTENFTNNLEKIVFKAESSDIATNLAIPSENLINILEKIASKAESCNNTINSSSPTENMNRADLTDVGTNPATSTENLTKQKIEKKSLGSCSINDYIINFTNSPISIEELKNIIKDDSSILGDEIDGLDENIGEELNQPVAEKEDSTAVEPPEKQESVGGDKSYGQPVGTPRVLDPILVENIKQLTITREQLMEERAKAAASKAYLRARHKCESCIIGFQFYENLKDHYKRKHTHTSLKPRDIICDVCEQFVEHGAINIHTFYHYTRYQCVLCEHLFASFDKAALHYKRQHWGMRHRPKKGVTFKCPRCPYKTGRKRLLKDHMSECRTCKLCGVSIGTMADISLETHLIYCTGGSPEPKRAKPTHTSTATEALED